MFVDRADAGMRLAARLECYRASAVVLGLPCGGVPVAAQVAAALGLPLDVIVVSKLRVPGRADLAMGALAEGGVRALNPQVLLRHAITCTQLAAIEIRERARLRERVRRLRSVRARLDLAGRTAIIVDDGIATGATARAACLAARTRQADRVVLAAPVGPRSFRLLLADAADELICARPRETFLGIGREYLHFPKISEEEVLDYLRRATARPIAPPALPAPPGRHPAAGPKPEPHPGREGPAGAQWRGLAR